MNISTKLVAHQHETVSSRISFSSDSLDSQSHASAQDFHVAALGHTTSADFKKRKLRLLSILAHPDDEALGMGGTLAKYAGEGVETFLITGTRGERGWIGSHESYPGPESLGTMREAELVAAACVLGLKEVEFLDYLDGDLDQADPEEAISRLVYHIRRLRPDVVVTFDPTGMYGHPDHIAISQFTAAAIMCSADPGFAPDSEFAPHRVSKLYYRVFRQDELRAHQDVFGELRMHVDAMERFATSWHEWAITTRIDASLYWRTIWQAIVCHASQVPNAHLREERFRKYHREGIFGCEAYYRVFSTVNGGRQPEHDLFEGLR